MNNEELKKKLIELKEISPYGNYLKVEFYETEIVYSTFGHWSKSFPWESLGLENWEAFKHCYEEIMAHIEPWKMELREKLIEIKNLPEISFYLEKKFNGYGVTYTDTSGWTKLIFWVKLTSRDWWDLKMQYEKHIKHLDK